MGTNSFPVWSADRRMEASDKHMSRHSDVLIIGGGIIGLSCAYYLMKAGRQVRLIEQDKTGEKKMANEYSVQIHNYLSQKIAEYPLDYGNAAPQSKIFDGPRAPGFQFYLSDGSTQLV